MSDGLAVLLFTVAVAAVIIGVTLGVKAIFGSTVAAMIPFFLIIAIVCYGR